MHLTAQLVADQKTEKTAEELFKKALFLMEKDTRLGFCGKLKHSVSLLTFASAIGQLKSLERRLEKEVTVKERYQETIETNATRECVR